MEVPAKKVYTDAERLELAEKLDKACDDFMEELAANQKTEPKKPFNFDEWCKEIDNHPAFMNDLSSNPDGELPAALQALQALKYDTDGEDLLDAAIHHKDEGNKHFKYKKYRWAIDCYTEAAKLMVPDRKLNAVIYCNRATAHKYLGNHSSGLKDSLIALKFD
uniref:Tetratricopeptide repeat protein n=1 Tax=Panagrolaimus sp. PS1159 TaxID=55785 RepID=A0AC35G8P1_9BILA